MNVLITGGAGFIGSHLCDLLIREGHSVICMDNFITGKKDNVKHLFGSPDFELAEYDVANPVTLEKRVDYILNLASPASPPDYLKYPIETLKVGSFGTYNLLELAKAHKAKFLIASTSEVYGDPLVNPQPETYWGNVNSIGPRSVYDEAKRFSEAITMAYHRSFSIDTKIVRIFNTYGPRMRANDGRAIPNFIDQALKSEPLTVYGDGSQTRSFCYVTDLIAGIYALMKSNLNEPVNIGNPNEMTLLELAKKIIELIGSKSRIEYKPLPTDDPKVRRPDIEKAKAKLHWQPEVSLDKGLADTIKWFSR